jgi:hypothetical protein
VVGRGGQSGLIADDVMGRGGKSGLNAVDEVKRGGKTGLIAGDEMGTGEYGDYMNKKDMPHASRCVGRYVVVSYDEVPYPGYVETSNGNEVCFGCIGRVTTSAIKIASFGRKRRGINVGIQLLTFIPPPRQIGTTSEYEIEHTYYISIVKVDEGSH